MLTPTPLPFPPTRTLLGLALLAAGLPALAEPTVGQLLYVPVYSEVPYGNKGFNLALTATLSIRNTDRTRPLSIRRVDYHGVTGRLLKAYLTGPIQLNPMAAQDFVVKEADRSGGTSASFLVEWEGEAGVSAPYVEAVMVHSTYEQGIAFNSPARVLEERR